MSCTSDTACTTCAAGYYEETDADSVDTCLCEYLSLRYFSHYITFNIMLRLTLRYVLHCGTFDITLCFTLRYVLHYVTFHITLRLTLSYV